MLILGTATGGGAGLQSLYDMIMNGGPLMVPLGLCSVVALAYIVERTIRLQRGRLGRRKFGADVIEAVERGGADEGLKMCDEQPHPLSRIFAAGLKRVGAPYPEVEKAVEDAGSREVSRLSANLRPLVVVGMIAPLLGLLGTVWGMIQAFSNIALKDGLGKPELLASGISQALITTAVGLAIAIPTQAAYYYFRSRIDRFVRDTEDLFVELSDALFDRPEYSRADS